MSFNSQRDGILPYDIGSPTNIYSCFNSQRDGILQNLKRKLKLTQNVSIPNGMEFYGFYDKGDTIVGSFNSQRDGILPKMCLRLRVFHSFNSQRDGILLLLKAPRLYTKLFQFPTGWNSTMVIISLIILRMSFNSQRDGILHLQNTLEVGAKTRFNSQRDGILLVL